MGEQAEILLTVDDELRLEWLEYLRNKMAGKLEELVITGKKNQSLTEPKQTS